MRPDLAVLPLLAATLTSPLAAQEPPDPSGEPQPTRQSAETAETQDPPPFVTDPVVVTATRVSQPAFDAPYATAVVPEEEIRRRSYRTTPQALRNIPGVMVQETGHGQGSPYIRGFTGHQTLMLIDGIRLNNSVFRSGPNQYWNTVDPLSLDRLDLVKGPSSVLYGSDAIGGTVIAFTRSPWTYAETGFDHGGSSYLRYASAENSITGRAEISLGNAWDDGSRTGLLIGGSIKSFGDVEGGRGTGTQPETGYDEIDLDLKLDHWLDPDTRLTFAHYRVRLDAAPRTHRTVFAVPWRGTTVGSDLRRDFDQERYLTYLQFHKQSMGGAVDTVRASLSWHHQSEERNRIRGNGNQEFQGFEVGTLGAWLQLESPTTIGRFTYGAEYYRDHVDSYLRSVSNPSPADAIQGPVADDATYDLLGVFVQDQIPLGERLELTLGGRFNYAAVDAKSVRDPVTDTKISIEDDWSDVVGSARLRWQIVPENLNLYGGISQGFRAPNLSDLTRFDSARTNEFEIPAPALDAERYVGYEIGVKARNDDANAELAYFYTDIEDQILRLPTGNTNPAGEDEVTKANVGDGWVWGLELGAAWRFLPELTAFGNATYMEGKVLDFENPAPAAPTETWLSRLMPLTAQVGLRWEEETGRFWAETAVLRAEDADKLSLGDQRDTSRIPPGGTASYTVWDIRTGWAVSESASLYLLLENITDADFRVHGSGLNRPGRNLVIGVHATF